MLTDKLVKWMLGAAFALMMIIGGTAAYNTLRPADARADSYYVELGAICNAYIEGDAPWCAQVFNIGDTKKLGTMTF